MVKIEEFIFELPKEFLLQGDQPPWEITTHLSKIIETIIPTLAKEFEIKNGIAIHRAATIEEGAILKGPIIINENCFVGSNAYLRGGVFLAPEVKIGPGCEIKTSLLCANSAIAHLSFVGDCIIGQHVNMEAGAVIANHWNERHDKTIIVVVKNKIINTGVTKFGAIVGDHSKIGANAVLSPGTILPRHSTVKRLELIEQLA